jgi:hypothetical protein
VVVGCGEHHTGMQADGIDALSTRAPSPLRRGLIAAPRENGIPSLSPVAPRSLV